MALDVFLVVSLFVLVENWFGARLLARPHAALLALGTLALWIVHRRGSLVALRPGASTVAVCGLAILLRVPAFVEPAGFVGADGSLQALLIPGILNGYGPAPVFVEGSNYQGSLKAHLGALAALVVGRSDLGLLVVIGSTTLWTMFVAATMSLGRRLGGTFPAVVAGLFVALSPRFATIFSISNVGEYPDVLGLGTCALASTASLLAEGRNGFEVRGRYLRIGLLLGIALWQQPIAISFALVALGALGLRALIGRDPWFLVSLLGLAIGRLPVTIHNLQTAFSNDDVVGGFLRSAGASLTLIEHLSGTLQWAFPIVFAGFSNDSALGAAGRGAIGLSCTALIAIFLARALGELKAAFRNRTFEVVRVMCGAQFLAAISMVWLVAGGGQYERPRYFLPLLTGFALALGDVAGVLRQRWRKTAIALAALLIGSNAWSNAERLETGLAAGRDLRALALRIEQLGLRTGYSGIALAGPLIMLTNEQVSVDGILGSVVGQRLPARHTERVRVEGPDFYLAAGEDALRLERRFAHLGVSYQSVGQAPRLFYRLSRRVPLGEIQEKEP